MSPAQLTKKQIETWKAIAFAVATAVLAGLGGASLPSEGSIHNTDVARIEEKVNDLEVKLNRDNVRIDGIADDVKEIKTDIKELLKRAN